MITGKSFAAVLFAGTVLAGCNEDDGKKATTGTFAVPAAATKATKPLIAGTGQEPVVSAGKDDNGNKHNGDAGKDDKGIAPRVDIPLTQFVNAFVGTSVTETGGGHSGNLNPGAQTPFGMVSFGPDTEGSGTGFGYGSGGYYYDDSSIQYFSMTHLNGPGCRGQGAVAILPNDTDAAISTSGIAYSHANETASPGYYQVKFDNGINSEFTATTRTGMARFTFPDKDKAYLIIDASRNNTNKDGGVTPVNIKIADDRKSVSGQAIAPVFCGGTWKQPVYFFATFDKPLKKSAVANDAATLQFDLADADKSMQLKVGISSVSVANAKLNLETENGSALFDET
jgi:putative alpha-1,2-mannosidase